MDNVNNEGTIMINGVVYQAVAANKPQNEVVAVETKSVAASPETHIVVDGENTYEFERANINDPFSILSYGNDVQEEISSVLESAARMSVVQQKTYISDEMLKKIVSFDESLEEAKRSQEQKVGLLKKWITNLRIGLNDESAKKEEEMKTYAGRYNDYTNNLKEVCENLTRMAQDSLKDIRLREDIAENLNPVIAKLEAMVEAGKRDKQLYDEETAKIGIDDQTKDGQAIVTRRAQLSNTFAKQLNGLAQAVVLYKSQIQQYLLQQNTSMVTVQEAHDFIKKQSPVLQSQASVQIFNHQESVRLDSILNIKEAANIAIEKSARDLTGNIEKASELTLNSGFSLESIEAVMSSIEEGVSIIRETKKRLIQKNEEEQASLDRINERLESNKVELLEMIGDQSAALLALEESKSKGYSRKVTLGTNKRPGISSNLGTGKRK